MTIYFNIISALFKLIRIKSLFKSITKQIQLGINMETLNIIYNGR